MQRHPAGGACVVGAMAALALGAQDSVTFVDPAAESLFRYSRMAVTRAGGSVVQLKSLALKGRSRLTMPDRSLASGTVDIKILLPDHYLRSDVVGSSERLAGYAGRTVLSVIRENGRTSTPPDDLRPQILKSERLRLARLLLGATTYVSGELALTLRSIGGPMQMIDPRSSARLSARVDVSNAERFAVDVSGENFGARLVMDATSQVPVRLVYSGTDKAPFTMTFADRRPVDGFDLPFHITTTSGSQMVEDLLFDEIRVNPELDKGVFKP